MSAASPAYSTADTASYFIYCADSPATVWIFRPALSAKSLVFSVASFAVCVIFVWAVCIITFVASADA